jgi:hypothetical protein
VTDYTATTQNATNTFTATAADPGATVSITVNGEEHSNGTAITWQDGENIVLITVVSGSATLTYTITVTKA